MARRRSTSFQPVSQPSPLVWELDSRKIKYRERSRTVDQRCRFDLNAHVTGTKLFQNWTAASPAQKAPLADRSRLPAALQNVRLDRLSSGALMLLDRGGDLVEWPAASSPVTMGNPPSPEVNATVALDPRVGRQHPVGR